MNLEKSYEQFMTKLQDDVREFLGYNTAFMLKIDVNLAVKKENKDKMDEYVKLRLNPLLKSIPDAVEPLKKENLQ